MQLLVELDDVEPTVWRRLLVPAEATLATLHQILQASVGWSDSHLHSFLIAGTSYGTADDEDDDDDPDEDQVDEASISLLEALDGRGGFEYEYDFGDGWTHQVAVEAILPHIGPLRFAVCLGGENACPPEDVGGPEGYRDFLVALADPTHEEHADVKEWIGGSFDPEEFDVARVNVLLQGVR
jgi:Plasmid pRiA4b ORF-3-like protein